MGGKSATARTIEAFEAAHFRIESCEKWVKVPDHPAGGIRRDLFGVLDLIAIRPGLIVGVQSTTTTVAEHNRKIASEKRAREWMEAGGILVMLAWRYLKVDGKRVRRPRVFRYRLEGNTIEWDEVTTLRDAIPEMIIKR